MRRLLHAVLLTAMVAPAIAHAQAVHGQVVESGSGQPLYGSIIVLLDSAEHRVAGAISDERGRFTVSAPGPGRYLLRANRIGFRSTSSPSFTLAAGQTLEARLVASAIPIELATIQITGKERCTTRPEEGRAAFTVWNEVRKALTAATLTEQQRLLQVRIRRFERDVDPKNGHVRSERSWEQSGVSAAPFVALPADTLERGGYARLSDTASWYYAPDAEVLLSDAFSADHCFRVQRSDSAPTRLIGLAFEPVRERSVADVQGVLWLDRATSELRSMDFHYVKLPRAIPPDRFGGELEFRRLPTGAWIVQRWVLHMPVLAVRQQYWVDGSGYRHDSRDTTIAAVHETGGAVLTVTTRDGKLLRLGETATLRGTVLDSTSGRPLAGAVVAIAGTADATPTDSSGRFVLDALGAGEYEVRVSHPRLDSLTLGQLSRLVKLRPGTSNTVELAVPSLASIARAVCSDDPLTSKTALVAGTVREASWRRPIADAVVTASWATWKVDARSAIASVHSLEASSDSAGHYHLCGVPAGVRFTVTARSGEQRGTTIVVPPLSDGEVALREVIVGEASGTPD